MWFDPATHNFIGPLAAFLYKSLAVSSFLHQLCPQTVLLQGSNNGHGSSRPYTLISHYLKEESSLLVIPMEGGRTFFTRRPQQMSPMSPYLKGQNWLMSTLWTIPGQKGWDDKHKGHFQSWGWCRTHINHHVKTLGEAAPQRKIWILSQEKGDARRQPTTVP